MVGEWSCGCGEVALIGTIFPVLAQNLIVFRKTNYIQTYDLKPPFKDAQRNQSISPICAWHITFYEPHVITAVRLKESQSDSKKLHCKTFFSFWNSHLDLTASLSELIRNGGGTQTPTKGGNFQIWRIESIYRLILVPESEQAYWCFHDILRIFRNICEMLIL